MADLQTTIDNIIAWGEARGFYGEGGTTAVKQGLKGVEELGEVAKAYNKNDLEELKLEIGDVGVCGIHAYKISGEDLCFNVCNFEDQVEDARYDWSYGKCKDSAVAAMMRYLAYDLTDVSIYDFELFLAELAFLAELNGFTLEECLEGAYEKIKYRKGRMVNGVWVKES